jgi:UDP-galactopyranose mutase
MEYDYLIVGAGLYGSLFAHIAKEKGKRCLVIDKRDHTGGNIYCKEIEGINTHVYGPHVFHTSNEEVWSFVNGHVKFNNFICYKNAIYKDKLLSLPFNMNTFHQLWGVKTPIEAREVIENQKYKYRNIIPSNLEEKAKSLVGDELYEYLVKGYVEKQWGTSAKNLPCFIIERLPLRFTFDNNYFNDRYQGVPVGGYNSLINKFLNGVNVRLNTDFYSERSVFMNIAKKNVFTGSIDKFFDYKYGKLDSRSLRFENVTLDIEDFQGTAIVSYTNSDVPFTRIVEHKHFEFGKQPNTVITYEYPLKWEDGLEPFYPINIPTNDNIYNKYKDLSKNYNNIIFGGRLAEYKYYDMDDIVEQVLNKKHFI